jgi:3'-5' exoribonuclease
MAEKGFFIAALRRDGVVTFLALVRAKGFRTKRSGGIYLHLMLADRTGEMDAKVWDAPEATASLFERDDTVKVRGTIELYNDRSQLIVQRIRRCEDGEFQEADFWPTSARDPEEMFVELQGFAESVANEQVRALLQSILADPAIAQAFKVAPAALQVHHAYRTGLLDHSLSLCQLVDHACWKVPATQPRLLIAGAVLHDIGKIEELGTSRRLGYTTRGQLVGHVALGLEILERHISRLPGFPVKVKSMLQHRWRYQIPPVTLRRPEELTVQQVAQHFGVRTTVVYYWIERRLIQARQLNQRMPYWITLNGSDEEKLQNRVRNSSRIQKSKVSPNATAQSAL